MTLKAWTFAFPILSWATSPVLDIRAIQQKKKLHIQNHPEVSPAFFEALRFDLYRLSTLFVEDHSQPDYHISFSITPSHITFVFSDAARNPCFQWTESRPKTRVAWRDLGHRWANPIYRYFTQEDPHFDQPLVCIAQPPAGGGRDHRVVCLVNPDGQFPVFLTPKTKRLFLPTFSPNRAWIAYLEHHRRHESISVMSISTQESYTIPVPRAYRITSGPIFSPNGQTLLFAASRGKKALLCLWSLTQKNLQVLTIPGGGLCNGPSFSPDGKEIAFVGEIQGQLSLLCMDLETHAVRILSQEGGRYYTCSWSPRKDWIAFVKSFEGHFYLGILHVKTQREILLMKSYLIDRPCWALCGRRLFVPVQQGEDRMMQICTISPWGERNPFFLPTITYQGQALEMTDPHKEGLR